MTMPPAPERDLPVRDGNDVRRLREELDRLVAENAALRTALATPGPDTGTVRTLVRRRWIGGVASVLLLALGIAVGVWYARYVGPDMVRGFREGFREGSAVLAPTPGTPVAAPQPPSTVRTPAPPAPPAPKR